MACLRGMFLVQSFNVYMYINEYHALWFLGSVAISFIICAALSK